VQICQRFIALDVIDHHDQRAKEVLCYEQHSLTGAAQAISASAPTRSVVLSGDWY